MKVYSFVFVVITLFVTNSLFAWTIDNSKTVPPFFLKDEAEKLRYQAIYDSTVQLHKIYNRKRGDQLKRTQHHKVHGCLKGTFKVEENIAKKYQVGIFKLGNKPYKVIARFSNIGKDDDRDKDLRGLGLKVLDPTKEPSLLIGQDFLANDTPKHFVKSPEELLDFLLDLSSMGPLNPPSLHNMKLMYIANQQIFKRRSLLIATYFSRTHYKFGDKLTMRYGIFPCSYDAYLNVEMSENHLKENLTKEANSPGGICREFRVQFYEDIPNSNKMRMDDYTQIWRTRHIKLATIRFPQQKIEENTNDCDRVSFDPWNAVKEHLPLGDLNKGRWFIYQASRDESN